MTASCYAQRFGDRSGYNSIVEASRNDSLASHAWRVATKLSLTGRTSIEHPKQSECINFYNSNPSIGDSGKMSYWVFKIQTVLDSTNCVLSIGIGDQNRSFILSDYPTEQLVDNMSVVLADEVQFIGTRRIHARKLFVLKFITQLSVPTKDRKWHSAEGRVIVGSVTKIDRDSKTITLVRSDGQVFSDFPLSKLCIDDVKLIAPWYELKTNEK